MQEKQWVQIVVKAGSFHLYESDGWERIFEDEKLLTLRKRLPLIKT